jgi:endonuclease/exonuclease/phosphatase family metal-dependent hydrolase
LLRDEILDIVVLNEVDFDAVWSRHMNQGEFIARETGFPLWAEQRNIDIALPFARIRYGNVILSHYPILTARRLRFVGHSALESILMGKKEGLLCTIELSAAQRIRVLAVHLEHRQESKRLRAAKMMEEVRQGSPLPLIAAGDFNSTPINFPHATPDKDGQTALSWLLARGAYQTWPSKEPSRDDLTFWSLKPSRVIDWALVPIDWKIISKTVIDRPLSDHKAVVMEIEVNGDPGGH